MQNKASIANAPCNETVCTNPSLNEMGPWAEVDLIKTPESLSHLDLVRGVRITKNIKFIMIILIVIIIASSLLIYRL